MELLVIWWFPLRVRRVLWCRGDPTSAVKILHLTDNYPPTMGGLESFVQQLAHAQAQAGHSVTVVSSELSGQPNASSESGVRVLRMPLILRSIPGAFKSSDRVFFPPASEPRFQRALSRLLAADLPDVLHAHGWILYSAVRPAFKLGVAIVATAHDYGSVCAIKTMFTGGEICDGPGLSKCVACASQSYGPKGVPIAIGLRQTSRRSRMVNAWICPSGSVARAGSAVRAEDRREMTVIPCFAPESVLNIDLASSRPSFVPASGPYLLYVGALGRHKGVHTLLDAHRQLWDNGVQVPLAIAGFPVPGQDFDFHQPGVSVTQDVQNEHVMRGWVNAAVGIVPSAWAEPFGQVALECMAAGTPVVVTRVGGLPEVIGNGECGLLVDPQDPRQLAEAIATLLHDATLARTLGDAGRRRARTYSSSVILDMTDEVYATAMARRAP